MSATRPVLSAQLFRWLCLLTAIANAGGNLLIFFCYRPVFELLGVPLPVDLHSFAFVCGFSFTVGVLAFMVFCDPQRHLGLLVVAIVGKGIYAALTAYFYFERDLHWFYKLFGIWDGAFVVIFFLFLIQQLSPDLAAMNHGAIGRGVGARRTGKALLLYYSLTGNGARAIRHVRRGLEAKGYAVTEHPVEAAEPLFRFPLGFLAFVRIMVRAIFRVPARARPLAIPADHDYDLIVVQCQTWLLGIGGPMEGVLRDPANRAVFAGRDAAAVVVCRGLWRRTEAMLVRRLAQVGANVVGARSCTNPGAEPMRTFSLFIYLATAEEGRPRWLGRLLTPQFLDPAALDRLERFGEALATRPPVTDERAPSAA
jgi:hypothetical protein